jgi:hypothetical protein
LQVKKSFFNNNRELFSNLRASDFLKASEEEKTGRDISNPEIKTLKRHLRAVRARVVGTDEYRISMRSKVWGTTAKNGPPNVWLTLNPPDYNDPIAQVITGADIDLDKFCSTGGPDHIERSRRIAADPWAAAKYFHFIVNTILEVLFGIKKTRFGVERKPGILGTVQAYLGTVEAQGRGALHLHMLLWLKDAPTASVMQDALKNEAFRCKIRQYIHDTVHADIDGKNEAGIRAIPKITEISYSRPVDPTESSVEGDKQQKLLARALQLHTCHPSTCSTLVKGRWVCKRGAPFAVSAEDWVDESGAWGPKRACGFLNNWNNSVITCLRGNHDLKLVMNGRETCVAMLYSTNYTYKKQNRTSNASALLAEQVQRHEHETPTEREDLLATNKRLLQRCANALFTEREFSGPEIHSLLMGWSELFESHSYVMFYCDAASNALKRAYPYLSSNP